jgi:predicted GIY-YIG superfamily endonuclease
MSSEPVVPQSKWFCYFIHSTTCNRTYVGKTNDFKRRLRQHNGELCGGAKYTKGKGPWKPFIVVSGFRSNSECLQFEWAMHHPSRVTKAGKRKRVRKYGIKGRCQALELLLMKSRWTSKAPLAEERPLTVTVHKCIDKKKYCKWLRWSEANFARRRKAKPFVKFVFLDDQRK